MDRQQIAEKYFAAFYNANHAEKAGTIVEALVAPDFADYSPQFGAPPDKQGFKQTVGLINSAFRQHYCVEHLIIENNSFAGVWNAEATHIGEFMGVPPTHKVFRVSGITIYKIIDDKIKAHWEQFDVVAILRALGILRG